MELAAEDLAAEELAADDLAADVRFGGAVPERDERRRFAPFALAAGTLNSCRVEGD
jgi:hypothetical protein